MLSSKSRILVVDDFETVRALLRKCLAELGFADVVDAADGADAFFKMDTAAREKRPFDVVFLDWNLPKMNGMEFILACRTDDRFRKTPIIMVTAESDRENVVQALQSGANDYIIKPFDRNTLRKRLEKFGGVKAA